MKASLAGTIWRLGIFVVVCLLGLSLLVAVFGQLRFEPRRTYSAEFVNVGGLKSGDFVRIAGVEVGKVGDLQIRPDAAVDVSFTVDDSVRLLQSTRAEIRYDNLYGDRYLALEEGSGEGGVLPSGGVIPFAQTAPALDLDTLIGGFRPLFRALDPDQVNTLASQLIRAFEGQGETVNALLTHTAALTNTLADPRGRWLLDNRHAGAASELDLSTLRDGVLQRRVIDRSFVDDGTRWIVDFKTSTHEGADTASFVRNELARYRAQLAGYCALMRDYDAGHPPRAALYLPLIDDPALRWIELDESF